MLTDIEKKLEQVLDGLGTYLNERYPAGYAGFGVYKNSFIVPDWIAPKGFDVDWKTGKILTDTPQGVEILLPNITLNYQWLRDIKIFGCRIFLQKQVGDIQWGGYGFVDLSLQVEVLDIEPEMLTLAFGFVKTR